MALKLFGAQMLPAAVPTPSAGDTFLFVDSSDGHLKQKDSGGTVLDAVAGSATEVVINGGSSNLPATGTELISWGHNAANDGLVLPFDVQVIGVGVRSLPGRSAGAATLNVVINGITTATSAILDLLNPETAIDNLTGAPIAITAGQVLAASISTVGWSPTSSDCAVMMWLQRT